MNLIESLSMQFKANIKIEEKRPGTFQLYAPLFHEDGDMMEIYLEPRNDGSGLVRVCDYGMTIQRLSYAYDLDTPNKERIFNKIISENKVGEENGKLFIEARSENLYPAILQFTYTIGKVLNMQYFRREVMQSLFYEYLSDFITTTLPRFNPRAHVFPIETRDDLEVDWLFDTKPHQVFLFGVKDYTKARLVTIACLEFQLAKIPFTSYVVHEDFDNLTRKDRSRITSAADKQFVSFDDFKDKGLRMFEREIAMA